MPTHHTKASLIGIQHLLAMYAGAIAVPLLIGTGLGLSSEALTYLLSIDILMCGVATLLQVTMSRYFGIGLPVMLGCAIQGVGPAILIGQQYGLPAVFGAVIAAGVFLMVFARLFSKIKRLFPPIVTGTVITTIGLTLIPVAIEKMGGGNQSGENFGSFMTLLQAFITIVLILVVQGFGKGFIRSISVLIGLVGGTLFTMLTTGISTQPIQQATLFQVPKLFYFGMPTFHLVPIVLMIIIVTVCMVESTGVYFALAELSGKELSTKDLERAYRTEGFAILLGGLVNTFPHTGFSQNVGLVQLSKITSRKPIVIAGSLLVVLGLFPKVGAVAQVIPEPVLGGGMLVMFGMVAVAGLRMLSQTDFSDERNLLTVAISLGFGLGFNMMPTLFAHFPEAIQMFTSNGIVMSSISAVCLNSVFHINKRKQNKMSIADTSL